MRRETLVVSTQHRKLRFPHRETFRVINRVLRLESKRTLKISVVFVDNRFIKRINLLFLGHNYVTDVIVFPLADGVGVDAEIHINLDRARSQAKECGVSFREEVRRLLIHGTLHLLGYKDITLRQKKTMKLREDHYLRLLRD